jgi:Na+-translocating ferredoxin:NAD+ oxidoreductase RnfG subunit
MSDGETMMLSVKAIMFLALELTVFAIFGAILIAGLHQIVQDKVQKARQADQIAGEAHPAAPA